jgi:cold shock CspA family protein
VTAVGRITRFDDIRGYGFIAPSGGGEDVFVHANDFGDQRHLVRPGVRVEYEEEAGERGLKVASVRILETPTTTPVSTAGRRRVDGDTRQGAAAGGDDDAMCDVLTPDEFTAEVTEMLIRHAPSLTGAQITQVRDRLVNQARSHGWVEG